MTLRAFLCPFPIIFSLCLASLPSLVHAAVETLIARQASEQAQITAFVRSGCPHCDDAKQFLATLAKTRPSLRIEIHDIQQDQDALETLKRYVDQHPGTQARVPAFLIQEQLIVGFSTDIGSDKLIVEALDRGRLAQPAASQSTSSCELEESLSCKPEPDPIPPKPEEFRVDFLGKSLTLDEIGLPAFTLVMGLLDGFNPCSLWVLLLMISLLAPMGNRWRMLAVAGTFVAVEGIAYFVFMAAWLNLFLLIGLSRWSELAIAAIALVAGAINVKDFLAFGVGPSLSIPQAAKPDIYNRIRQILQADNLTAAVAGATVLAVLVQMVELLCTSGFPALYTRILTLNQLDSLSYYAYLLLYNVAYMLDDVLVLTIGIVTLSQHRLQEKEGRWLKLISGVVMIGLALYLASPST